MRNTPKLLIMKKMEELANVVGNNIENLFLSDIMKPIIVINPKLK